MAISRRPFIVSAAAFVAFGAAGFPRLSRAHSYRLGDLTIGHPWSRATVGTGRPGVGYLSVANAGRAADRLIAAESPLAARVELHRSVMDGDVMRMERVEAIEIPAGAKVALEPGGHHLMLIGPVRAFREGEMVPLALVFERAGRIEVELKVAPLGGPGGKDHGHGHHHH